MSFAIPFDICALGSTEVKRLLDETNVYTKGVRIEQVPHGKGKMNPLRHPADLVGLKGHTPTIRIVDSLNRQQRVEAIAHELVHLLLVYRFGLGLVIRRRPCPGDRDAIFKYYLDIDKDWFYLLGQIGNTTHHLFLIDYLRRECGIESDVHGCLLHQNFCILASEVTGDVESLYAKGLIAFEYERLIGGAENVAGVSQQSDLFWRAYYSASRHFGHYCLPNIPVPSRNEENILSFLGDLGYEVEGFKFFP